MAFNGNRMLFQGWQPRTIENLTHNSRFTRLKNWKLLADLLWFFEKKLEIRKFCSKNRHHSILSFYKITGVVLKFTHKSFFSGYKNISIIPSLDLNRYVEHQKFKMNLTTQLYSQYNTVSKHISPPKHYIFREVDI